MPVDQITVGIVHVEAVFFQNGFHFKVKCDIGFPEQVGNDGVADFELAFGVEIDLVESAAGCIDFDIHVIFVICPDISRTKYCKLLRQSLHYPISDI